MNVEEYTSQLLEICRQKNLLITTAESCTGGLVAVSITDIAGASDVFDRGFVTYSNKAKSDLLGIPPELIETHGAVSQEIAVAMAEGAIQNSAACLSCSVTGIAGPDGGTKDKPVGLVYVASSLEGNETKCIKYIFQGDRKNIRQQAADAAIILMLELVGEHVGR